jgi:hypothetical protein
MKDNSPFDTRESRMTLGAMLRHALSDLVFRKGLTLLVTATVAIAAAYTLCLCPASGTGSTGFL